jgi:hypothetical protein
LELVARQLEFRVTQRRGELVDTELAPSARPRSTVVDPPRRPRFSRREYAAFVDDLRVVAQLVS